LFESRNDIIYSLRPKILVVLALEFMSILNE
jgi:hypothetical protein